MIHNYIDGKTNPVVKGSSWTYRRFGVQHHRQSVAMKGKVGYLLGVQHHRQSVAMKGK